MTSEPNSTGPSVRPDEGHERDAADRSLLNLIYDAVTDCVFLASVEPDETFRMLSVNPAFLKVTGLPAAAVVGRTLDELLPEPSIERARGKCREALETNATVEWEARIEYPSGALVGHIKLTPVADTATGARYLVGVVRDLTALRAAEERLVRSEARFRAMTENSSDIISVHDRHGVMVYQSPSIKHILGYEQNELIGRNVLDYIHPDEHDNTLREIEAVRSEPGVHAPFHTRFLHKNGTWRWCECTGSNLLDDPSVGNILFNARDITLRKRAEEALRESERLYRETVENANDIIYMLDLDGRYLAINRAGERLTGYTREECRAMSIEHIVAPESIDEVRQRMREKEASGNETVYELVIVTKDGRRLTVEVNSRALTGERGEPVGVLGIARDVTERRQGEERLVRAEAELRQAQKIESIGRLAGGVAHDFNNMLTAINGYGDLLLRQLGQDHNLAPYVDEIKRAADRAGTLTYQLLAFSRKQILQPTVLNVNDIVGDLTKMLERLIGEDIQFTAELDPDLASVEADPGQIAQVVMNLVINARDAIAERGGMIRIATHNEMLDAPSAAQVAVRPGEYVVLEVADSGPGMDDETVARVFEPFFTTKDIGKGTGMGLAIVQGIIVQSGGGVTVQSAPGKGATFSVFLPRVEGEAERAAAEGPSATLVRGTGKILIVEDEEIVRDLTRRILVMCGYEVIEAGDGEHALELVEGEARDVDLLVTDVVMPHMGGPELAERLARIRPSLPVLYISGYADHDPVRESAHAGFLQKPFTPDDLAAKVRALIVPENSSMNG